MNPRRKKRLGLVLALVVGLGATVGLMLYALSQNMDLFYTPTEIVNGKANGEKPEVGQRLRIGGMVVEGSVSRDNQSLKVSFDVADVGPAVTVVYEGILPDLFREGQGIVAQGVLTDATTVEAFEVLAKHDEEYMPPEIAEAMKWYMNRFNTQMNRNKEALNDC
ncbi:cytochrome c-type biogenesis protein ccmE [Vibrio ishigakensis]|uniref:Cytochrome c-type biogenesis protein CcmE n=1 Tax=Vibrio ishigakensis TaxID=1481914 RepID=A0A0B8Q4K0_9VIBR|nr:cytochrome c-type biogenesis protein ccmE [Vibrio ishigakensis]